MNKFYFIFLILAAFFSCEKAELKKKEFPVLIMQKVKDNNSSGARFSAKIIQDGTVPITNFGFVWSTGYPIVDSSFQISLGENLTKDYFDIFIDSSLSKGFTYKVSAFATYNTKTVYGGLVDFVSKGSDKSAWSLESSNIELYDYAKSYGCATNKCGYVVFQYSDFYKYDPIENLFSNSLEFPGSAYNHTKFASTYIDECLYLFSDEDMNLYKFENEEWSNPTKVPFSSGFWSTYYHCFKFSNEIILFSSHETLAYNTNTYSWNKLSPIPSMNLIGGTNLNDKVYIMTSERRIYQFDIINNNWNYIADYPGEVRDYIIAFSFGTKLFFGLSHDEYDGNEDWIDYNLWSYDINTSDWEQNESIPTKLPFGDVFFFYLNEELFLGHRTENKYTLYKIDLSRL